MIIENKFDKGDIAYFIHDNHIVKRKVIGISYMNGDIVYDFIITPSSDSGLTTEKRKNISEKKCFKSIDALAKYYKEKLDLPFTEVFKEI